jgi:hypothetical protein
MTMSTGNLASWLLLLLLEHAFFTTCHGRILSFRSSSNGMHLDGNLILVGEVELVTPLPHSQGRIYSEGNNLVIAAPLNKSLQVSGNTTAVLSHPLCNSTKPSLQATNTDVIVCNSAPGARIYISTSPVAAFDIHNLRSSTSTIPVTSTIPTTSTIPSNSPTILDTTTTPATSSSFSNFADASERRFIPKDVDLGDQFGAVADWTGDTVIAGCSSFNGINGTAAFRPGGAFIFTYNITTHTFAEQAVLEGDTNLQRFGTDVAIDGNTALVSTPFWIPVRTAGQPSRSAVGIVYVYKRNTLGFWGKTQSITTPNVTSGARFGSSISLDGNQMAVSAPTAADSSDIGSNGLVYVFERASEEAPFTLAQVLEFPMTNAGGLGSQPDMLMIRDSYLAVGVSNSDFRNLSSRSSVVTWSLQQPLIPGGGTSSSWQFAGILSPLGLGSSSTDSFGSAVALCVRNGKPLLAITAMGDKWPNTSPTTRGAVYLFTLDSTGRGWTELTVLRNATDQGSFGTAVVFDESCNHFAVGSGVDFSRGAIHPYTLRPNGDVDALKTMMITTGDAYDFGGQGLVWADNFIGTGALGNDAAGIAAGAFFFFS